MSKFYNDKSDDATVGALVTFGVLGIIALFIGMALYGAWAGAFVGSHLWAWFVSPVFGLPLLTKAQAYGIALLVSFWTYHPVTIPIKDERELSAKVAQIIGLLLYPWLIFVIGYVCKTWFLS